MKIKPPSFEINGKNIVCNVTEFFRVTDPVLLKNNVTEYVFEGKIKSDTSLTLKIIFRMPPGNAVVRYRYIISGSEKSKLTKAKGNDNLIYFSTSLTPFNQVKEVQFSNYDEKFHSYILREMVIEDRYFDNNYSAMGPMVIANNADNSFLLAYEHGSQYGNVFLHYGFMKDRSLNLSAVKGNYLNNQPISKGNEYETLWFEIAGVQGNKDALAAEYRSFMLKYISQNSESRQPYIFYNTWGRQEREHWSGIPYLQSMNLNQTLDEINKAHDMGIDVYVIDAGWFQKTGDWTVNTSANFFPDSLKQVVARLKKYNMKLGLWFNPTVASLSSKMLQQNKDCRTTIDGKMIKPWKIWETEESVPLCLASKYWEDFSDELIRLVKETGVTYFKWDAIEQGCCDAAGHYHGTTENTVTERRDYDAFLQPIYMSKIIDKVCKVCPEAIFDFDITEDGRSVGLAFLSSGKYYAINNGPNYHNLDISKPWETPLANGNANILVYPGPARGWFTRSILTYDKWIPSVLFLTHYQTDEPRNSQMLNIASLILGQNGIWGEILKTSPEGTKLFGDILHIYKQVKYDITLASPVNYGLPGESTEIHEKINPENGKGVVVIFGTGKLEVLYITKSRVSKKIWFNDGVTVNYDDKGRAVIKASFSNTGAKIIFFGVE
ncbi:MAG TPA: alpha-galactosidase [Chitinophagaceae bacterium]